MKYDNNNPIGSIEIIEDEFDNPAYITSGEEPKPFNELIDDFEERAKANPDINKHLDEAILQDLEDLCKRYSYRFKGNKIYSVDEDGKALQMVAKYSPLKDQLEIANSSLTDPKVAELSAQFAKSKNWKTVTVVPPKNAAAQKFMEVTLTALLQADMYEAEEVNVPKEYEAMKAEIAARLRNASALKEGNENDVEAPESAPAAEQAQPEPETGGTLENAGEKPEESLTVEEEEALAAFDNDDVFAKELSEDGEQPKQEAPVPEDDWVAEEISFDKPDNDSVDYDMGALRGETVKKQEDNEVKRTNSQKRGI